MAKPKLATVPVTTPPEAPVKKSKLKWILAAALIVLAGGGGAAWTMLRPHAAETKQVETKAPVFIPLEPFTVNLLEEGGDHYLQVGIVYQVADDKVIDTLKQYLPLIRSRILLLLSSKHPSDLTPPGGKQKLVEELIVVARESIPGASADRGISNALLSSFVIQ